MKAEHCEIFHYANKFSYIHQPLDWKLITEWVARTQLMKYETLTFFNKYIVGTYVTDYLLLLFNFFLLDKTLIYQVSIHCVYVGRYTLSVPNQLGPRKGGIIDFLIFHD